MDLISAISDMATPTVSTQPEFTVYFNGEKIF